MIIIKNGVTLMRNMQTDLLLVRIIKIIFDGVADAHLIRPGFTNENWFRLRPILESVLNRDELMWADMYHEAWMEGAST